MTELVTEIAGFGETELSEMVAENISKVKAKKHIIGAISTGTVEASIAMVINFLQDAKEDEPVVFHIANEAIVAMHKVTEAVEKIKFLKASRAIRK